MLYGIGFYLFTENCELLLVRKEVPKEYAKEPGTHHLRWLVPGDTDTLEKLKAIKESQKTILKALGHDIPFLKDDIRQCEYVGNWTYAMSERREGEYTFDNYLVLLRGLSKDELRQKEQAAREKKDNQITDVRLFHLLNLPSELSPLTAGFLKSLLFHRPDLIPARIGRGGIEQFSSQLGDESKRYFVYDNPVTAKGGYGEVYQVLDIASLSPRAIKIARPNVGDSQWAERFILEGTTLMSLLSEDFDQSIEKIYSINKVHDEQSNKKFFLVKNWLKGQTLQKQFGGRGQEFLSDRLIVELITRIVRTLHQLHSLRHPVYHRDIKPNNIMVSFSDKCKRLDQLTIIDLGLCRSQRYRIGTSETFLTGNPVYQSCNTINGQVPASAGHFCVSDMTKCQRSRAALLRSIIPQRDDLESDNQSI